VGQGQGGQALVPEGGTAAVDLEPLAFIARLAALVPPPKRHLVRYFGVLSSHAASRSAVVPAPAAATSPAEQDKPASKSTYIPWADLLRKTFGFEIVCQKCHSQLRLIALIKTESVAQKILKAMHLPTDIPELLPPRPPRPPPDDTGGGNDWLN
jgi:Putative transposase